MTESNYSRAVRKFRNQLLYSRGSRVVTHGIWRGLAAIVAWGGLVLIIWGAIQWVRFHYSAGAADADALEHFKKSEVILIGICTTVLGVAMRKLQIASGREPERLPPKGKPRADATENSKLAGE